MQEGGPITHKFLVLTVLYLFSVSGLAQPIVDQSGRDEGSKTVRIPRVWLSAKEVLITAHRQTGLKYAVLPPQFEIPVGPFQIDDSIGLQELVDKVGTATETEVFWIDDIATFEPILEKALLESVLRSEDSSQSPRMHVAQLAQLKHSQTVPVLSALAGSSDGSTRFHALAALTELEGDFVRNTWPGRLSIFEVLAEKLDRDALFFALEEGGPPGGQVWKMAAEILGRAREPSLTRAVWWNLWKNRPGTIRMTLWCLGRCGDPSGLGPLGESISRISTNDVADDYLAAIALGKLNGVDLLVRQSHSTQVDVRRAAALGLGLCADKAAASRALEGCLEDIDPAVQFITCQSLGRLGKTERLGRLLGGDIPRALWIAALEALSESVDFEEFLDPLTASLDDDPFRLAKVAETYGRHGGELASRFLPRLLNHTDRWVRASAVEALAKLGTSVAITRAALLAENAAEDPEVRIAALLGLGRSFSPEAAGPLSKVAGNVAEHYRLRHYAVMGLTRLAKSTGHRKLEQLVNPELPEFLPFAVRHVRFETPVRTASELIPLLTHGDRESACAAAGNLADLGYGPAVRELLEGSDIFDNHTRMMHSWGAIRAEGSEAAEALIKAAQSRRRLIRQGAALSLGGRHEPGAVDALIRFTSDKEDGVRAAAAQSLGLTGDPAAIPALLALAESDSSQAVRLEAIRALRSRDFADHPLVRNALSNWAGDTSSRRPIKEQGANTFVLRNWAEAYREDLSTNLTYETTMCYDSHSKRVIMWGAHGRRYDTPQTGQTWFFDSGKSVWQRLIGSAQWPNGSCCNRQIVFDSSNKLAVIAKSGRGASRGGHGWLNGLRGNLSFSIPWVLDVRDNEWYPMRPIGSFGNLGMVGGSYDPQHGLNVWWRGEILAYDAYANSWLRRDDPPGPEPERAGNHSAVFDPVTGRLIVVGVNSTWAYDPVNNQWEDLLPNGDAGPAEAPMVYDSTNDVMLALKEAGHDPMRVWVYHLRQNRWEILPAVQPAPQYGTMFDATYDPEHNVVVISGNESMSWSGALTARETWTYRYKPVDDKPDRNELELKVATAEDGTARLIWNTRSSEEVSGYSILRKKAENPLVGDWESIAQVSGEVNTYVDSDLPGKGLIFYSLVELKEEQPAGLMGTPVRTAPPALRWAAAVSIPGGVRVSWQPCNSEDVVGYHVFRTRADVRWPWHDVFDPSQQIGEFERVTLEPVVATEYVDNEVEITEVASELHWPKTFAYVIRAVNRWGVEGGPSPVTLALADSPGAVRVIPWLDGRRLVIWTPPRVGDDLRGYHVMRMDDWHRDYVFRWQAAPVVNAAFYDTEEFPRADRRRYYVSGVDRNGAVGIPSSGAWSHGLP